MALAGRNEPCPCGSGAKYKRCCGADRATEQSIEKRFAAIEELARIAYRSLRLAPDSDTYDAWVGALLAGSDVDIEAGIEALGHDESARIVSTCLGLYPDDWATLSERAASDRDAVAALLGGAVNAGIRDLRPVDRSLVQTIEESDDLLGDPGQALSLCLDGEQLWDDAEGAEADRAIASIPDWLDDDAYDDRWHETLGVVTRRLATEWHVRRLQRLVRRIGAELPFCGFPGASAAVERGCELFASEAGLRRHLAELMLGDMVGRETVRRFRTSLLAA